MDFRRQLSAPGSRTMGSGDVYPELQERVDQGYGLVLYK